MKRQRQRATDEIMPNSLNAHNLRRRTATYSEPTEKINKTNQKIHRKRKIHTDKIEIAQIPRLDGFSLIHESNAGNDFDSTHNAYLLLTTNTIDEFSFKFSVPIRRQRDNLCRNQTSKNSWYFGGHSSSDLNFIWSLAPYSITSIADLPLASVRTHIWHIYRSNSWMW